MAVVLLLVNSFFLVSCHSDYLTIDYKTHPGAVWNEDSTYAAFVASTVAFRSAEGISRFPDGGKPKYLVLKMGMYIYDHPNKKLLQIACFDDLARGLGASPALWKSKIAVTDTTIFYQIEPITNWQFYIENSSKDSTILVSLKNKYSNNFMHTLKGSEAINSHIDYSNQHKLGLTQLNKMLKKVPLSDWGLMVKEIFPKDDSEYIEETIYLFNHSSTARRAVVEQIIANKTKDEIEYMLQRMKKYESSLNGSERKEYEIFSKETYEQIRALL